VISSATLGETPDIQLRCFDWKMAFLSTLTGFTLALIIWVGLYAIASESENRVLIALAPYLEAMSISGQCLFIILASIISILTYRLLKRKHGDKSPDQPSE
jgi:hypothetical protein